MNKDLHFECIEDFADYIIGRVEDDEDLLATVVGKFETIKPLLKELMSYDFVDFENIEIASEFVDNYSDEFVLSIWMDDDVVEIGCEKLKVDGEYISPCGVETYLFEDCSYKIIPLCEDSDLYFVNFDDECECGDCCCGECSCDCHDGDPELVYYVVTDLPEIDIAYILKKFGF